MKKQKIYTFNDFDTYVFLEEKDPVKIQVCKINTEEPIIEFKTDAVDCMGFSDISNQLENLDQEVQQAAIHCFTEALKQFYGGKDFLAVPKKLLPLFQKEGFRVFPEIPNGNPYKRLMFVKKEEFGKNLSGIVSNQKERLEILSKRYSIISDKTFLQKRNEEISRLFIDNASYASNEDKRKGYSAQAINHRINNENVVSFALYDQQEDKIIGFMRAFVEPGIGAYVSDLVTLSEKRHQGLAILLMQQASLSLKEKNIDTIFLIAGDDKEAEYYEQKIGCKPIYSQKEPVTLADDKVFMFGLIPQKQLLKEFLDSFPMPEPPKEHKSSDLQKLTAISSKLASETKDNNSNENSSPEITYNS